MTNVKMVRKDNILTITVDLSKKGTPSATGKSLVIATSHGNQPVEGPGEIMIGINVYKKSK